MKKYFFGLFCALLLFVTGCGENKNQVKCTGEMEESGMKIKQEIVAVFDDNNIFKDATATMDLGSKETADQFCGLYKMFSDSAKGVEISCSGTKVTIKGFENLDSDEEDEDTEDSPIGKTKEEFIKLMEKEQMTCK